MAAPRLGLYKPWTANMDEGWTRWVLDTHEFTYNSLTNAEIQAGHLVDRYDAIILPDFGASGISQRTCNRKITARIRRGYWHRGTGEFAGIRGGRRHAYLLESCDRTPNWKYFGLGEKGIVNVVKKANQPKEDAFFCPGSLLRVRMIQGIR